MKDQQTQSEVTFADSSKLRGPVLEHILEIIDLYKDGVYNGNVESLKKAFHPESSMYGYMGKDLFVTPIKGLFDYVASSPKPSETGEQTNFIVTSIQVSGHAASVEMAMDAYHGHNFVDYFQLLYIEGRWWIVSKSFHADPKE